MAHTTHNNSDGYYFHLTRFSFSNKNFNNFTKHIEYILRTSSIGSRNAGCFLMKTKIIVYYFYGSNKNRISLLDFNFTTLKDTQLNLPQGYTIDNKDNYFSKGICLNENEDIGVMVIYYNSYFSYALHIISFSDDEIIQKRHSYLENRQIYYQDINLNDLIRLNDNEFIFVSSLLNNMTLNIFVFTSYNEYISLEYRNYELSILDSDTNFKLKSLSIFFYNDYLAATFTKYNSDITYKDTYFSMFILLGYPKFVANDNSIDIYPYFSKKDNLEDNQNLVFLINKYIIIDNNVFNYVKAKMIKLVEIPKEIIFYNNDDDELMLVDGDILDSRYKLFENKNII